MHQFVAFSVLLIEIGSDLDSLSPYCVFAWYLPPTFFDIFFHPRPQVRLAQVPRQFTTVMEPYQPDPGPRPPRVHRTRATAECRAGVNSLSGLFLPVTVPSPQVCSFAWTHCFVASIHDSQKPTVGEHRQVVLHFVKITYKNCFCGQSQKAKFSFFFCASSGFIPFPCSRRCFFLQPIFSSIFTCREITFLLIHSISTFYFFFIVFPMENLCNAIFRLIKLSPNNFNVEFPCLRSHSQWRKWWPKSSGCSLLAHPLPCSFPPPGCQSRRQRSGRQWSAITKPVPIHICIRGRLDTITQYQYCNITTLY